MKKEINIFVKDPGKPAERRTVPNTLEALQALVGGYIETVTVATDLAVICNEEGRLMDLPFNCDFCGISFVGTILIAGIDGEDFTDCPDLGRLLEIMEDLVVMVMTDEEILREYREAADQRKQVKILADENCTGIWEMATHLKDHGADISLAWFRRYNPKYQEQTADRKPAQAEAPAKEEAPVDDIFATLIRLENKLKLLRKKLKELENIV